MSDPNGPELWRNRFDAFNSQLNQTKGFLKAATPRQPTLEYLLESLQAFAAARVAYFYGGFSHDTLAISPKYPPEFIYGMLLDQLGNDLGVIQQTLCQRLNPVVSALGYNPLEGTDRLAALALNFATPKGYPFGAQLVTALTYFQKSSAIRVVPYARVALIGLSYSCLGSALDWLTIPHEVGHYIYRHTRLSENEQLSQRLENELLQITPSIPHYILRWTEEVFSDVYSCLVAGPLAGWTGQAQWNQQSAEQFFGDDGEHPASVLRPYIYHKVLNAVLANKATYSPAVLEKEWTSTLQNRRLNRAAPKQARQQHYRDANGTWRPISTVIQTNSELGPQPVDQMIATILGQLPMPTLTSPTNDWAECWLACSRQLPDKSTGWGEGLTAWVAKLKSNPADLNLPEVILVDPSLWAGSLPRQPLSPEDWMGPLQEEGWATKLPGNAPGFN